MGRYPIMLKTYSAIDASFVENSEPLSGARLLPPYRMSQVTTHNVTWCES